MSAVWIEAALNGPWGRTRQPLIPVTVEQIVADGIAAAKSGAGIIHVHAYDDATGEQRDDWEIYARIIEGIRGAVDVIVYPTIPLSGSGYAGANAERRFAHVAQLARRGLIEWTVLDPGSVNFVRYDEIGSLGETFIYRNSPDDLQEGIRLAQEHRLHPGYAIYEPGFCGSVRRLRGVSMRRRRSTGSCFRPNSPGASRPSRSISTPICISSKIAQPTRRGRSPDSAWISPGSHPMLCRWAVTSASAWKMHPGAPT